MDLAGAHSIAGPAGGGPYRQPGIKTCRGETPPAGGAPALLGFSLAAVGGGAGHGPKCLRKAP